MVITPTLTYASWEENYEEKGMKMDEEPKKKRKKMQKIKTVTKVPKK